jgi:N-alpha-acetyl-L-2,4-diaminobutyrate deacetylase
MSEPVACTIDLAAPGKQVGALRVPGSPDVPVASIANGDGPTVLVCGGNHGDEYEGQIAALRLIDELEPERVSGRIVVVPVVSTEASKAVTRFWPSGANFNRSFPGDPDGPPNERLAHFFTTVLFPLADVVMDIHSGGGRCWIAPCSHRCVAPAPAQRRAMLEGMEAWNTDFHFLYTSGGNYLPNEAERQGKVVITTELGGGGRVSAGVHRLAWSGLLNVLRHVGVLEGEVVTRASLGLPPAVIVDCRFDDGNVAGLASGLMDNVKAPVGGLLEGLVETGTAVAEGEPIARIWSPDDPTRGAVEIVSPVTGYVLGLRARTVVEEGNGLALVGPPIDRETLLAEAAA